MAANTYVNKKHCKSRSKLELKPKSGNYDVLQLEAVQCHAIHYELPRMHQNTNSTISQPPRTDNAPTHRILMQSNNLWLSKSDITI